MAAIARGSTSIVRLLIKHGAQVHGDHGHFSPLGGAAIRGNVAIMRAILAQGADPNKPVMSKEDAAKVTAPVEHATTMNGGMPARPEV